MTKFAQGGYIPPAPESPPNTVRMVSVGQCAQGHTLWLMHGVVTHLILPDEVGRRDYSKASCPNVVQR